LTHSRAISRWSEKTGVSINVFGIDIEPSTKEPFEKSFKHFNWSPSLDAIEPNLSFDLAVIATPIATIARDTVLTCRTLNINKVVIEKPAARTLEELNALKESPYVGYRAIVGFPRPSLPSSIALRDIIKSYGQEEEWNIEIQYGGSVLNILSHFLNLIEFLFEPFELTSFEFDADQFLRASFKSRTGRIAIKTIQYSETNDEKNSIFIQGPLTIHYTNSGRKIWIENPDGTKGIELTNIDFQKEINQMIGNFGNQYLDWALKESANHFTPLTSVSLFETLRLADEINVK
jgi:predicted dehydrogenase